MRTRSSGRFRKNSLAAAAATTAMGAASASATIIVVNPPDITLSNSGSTLEIDIPVNSQAADVNILNSSKGLQYGSITSNSAVNLTALDFGTTFGSNDLATNSGAVFGIPNVGDTGFLTFGIKGDNSAFTPGDSGVIFGWIHLTRGVDEVIVHEWAYEDQVDVAIFAGQGGSEDVAVTEPSALLILAIGAAVATRMHARRTRQ